MEERIKPVLTLNDRAGLRLISGASKPCSLSLSSSWTGSTSSEWFDYLLAGWDAVVERLKIETIGFDILVEGQCFIDGPKEENTLSVLSMSYKMASDTRNNAKEAFQAAFRKDFQAFHPCEELTSICANAERFIGKRGEKSIYLTQVLGSENMTVRLDYFPLRSRLVNIPHIAVFDMLNSGENARAYGCSTKPVDNVAARCWIAGACGAHVSGWTDTMVTLINDIRPVFLGDNLIYHASSSNGICMEFL
ncbi:unnamed protein product [Angiostrongylus costaricensis]|uniref:DUF2163 domain-containing protein n=1 Tax=Angiostrongylus costaricensis TaxID=334426 RepID=A0A158PLP4_ANGCS|nr:unnamed protein product [Angiostrongylus costaricensis]